jgi:nitrite reductase/ring-hydroxylating ferredoxin subunit
LQYVELAEKRPTDTRVPVGLAVTLIPDAYTSRKFFEIEREKVFATSWVVVGFTPQVQKTGQVIVAEVAGRSIIVTRDKQGELKAFHNVCRHRATKLLEEGCRVIRNTRIRCPYHSWTYDLEGRCLGTPLFEGSDIPEEARAAFDMSEIRDFDEADYGLLPAKAESWGFLVFVNLDPGAPHRAARRSARTFLGLPAGATRRSPCGSPERERRRNLKRRARGKKVIRGTRRKRRRGRICGWSWPPPLRAPRR